MTLQGVQDPLTVEYIFQAYVEQEFQYPGYTDLNPTHQQVSAEHRSKINYIDQENLLIRQIKGILRISLTRKTYIYLFF